MHQFPTGTVTLLFTDIEGSTRLLQQLGEGYSDLLAHCRQVLRTAFQQYHGHEVDTQGDAFFVAFARATDAVSAAVEAQRALAVQVWPQEINVRIGMRLHTGEPQLGAEGYMGLDVHRAARIMSCGHGGQVLLSQTTRDLVEHDLPDAVSLQDLGAHRLKDLEHPNHLYQLVTPGLPADFPPLQTLDTHTHNLPVQLTSLVGREREVAAVQQLLHRQEVRLLTLTGPGGTGKTRLGLQVAAELMEEFSDGVFFVNLAPISDPELVVPTIAQTLGIKEAPGQALLDLLSASLREKEQLLLLDNFEQVVGAAVEVAALLAGCPRLKVLVISRAGLHVRGEQEFAVPPLAVPDPKHFPDLSTLLQYEAVALFILRAQAAQPEFQVTNTNAPAVAEICVRLDGLPLAIELAAARIKLLPPQALLSRLEHRFQVLTSGAQDAPQRQQTLRNTLAWSYDLLSPREQRLFRHLAVFVGGCTLEAIEALCTALESGAEQVLDSVASLIDKNLLQQTERDSHEPRLLMLETIREYGLEALTVSGEVENTRQAHAAYFLMFAKQAEPEFDGPRQSEWFDRLEREHDNLRAALQWLLEQAEAGEDRYSTEMALRLGGVLQRLWNMHGHWSEGRQWLERVLLGSGGSLAASRVRVLCAAANLAYKQGDTHRAEELAQESLALCRELGDAAGIAHSLFLLGSATMARGHYTLAHSQTEEALTLWRQLGDKANIAQALDLLAVLATSQGEYAKGRLLFEENLALCREMGNKRGIADGLIGLAWVRFWTQDDLAIVRSLLEESQMLFKELGAKEGIADSFNVLGWVALEQGDAAQARSYTEQALQYYQEIGYWPRIAEVRGFLAKEMAAQGDYAAARTLYEESLALCMELGMGDDNVTAGNLEGLAEVVAAQGAFTWAARLWGAAETVRTTFATPIAPVDRLAYEHSVAAARAQLGEKAFVAALAEGRTMTPEQAIASEEREMNAPLILTVLPLPVRVPSPPTYPDGLTAREVEVLRLVAQGLSNAEIAGQLIISLLTVKAHMRSLYNKLGISSRSAATRYAIEHSLM